MAHAAIGYAASAIDGKTETYANVARIALDAITAYAEDVRAGRQIKGAPPAASASPAAAAASAPAKPAA
jgi:3-methyl-2-oxobutanoate hydroxymethyltransferase